MAFVISGHHFDGPHDLRDSDSVACDGPGLYVILDDARSIVYIGQSSKVRYRVGPSHHKWSCFHARATNPHVAFLCMPRATKQSRTGLERVLIKIHQPSCNG